MQSPAVLTRAGVKVAFFGDGASRRAMPTGRLGGEPVLNAAWAFRNGVAEADALKMVTLNPAEMFGMANRIGSIEPGKDADFLVLEGHPFEYNVLPEMGVHRWPTGARSSPGAVELEHPTRTGHPWFDMVVRNRIDGWYGAVVCRGSVVARHSPPGGVPSRAWPGLKS